MPAVRIADHDAELFAAAPGAADVAVAQAVSLERGPWAPERQDLPGHFGLLLLEGLMTRRVRLGGRAFIELLGPGDVIRPWVSFGEGSSISNAARWNVEQTVLIADLDPRFARRMDRWPEVGAALMDRHNRRVQWMALLTAISHQPKLQPRLLALLWSLSDRWGRVTTDGVLVPLPLTHELLAGLAGARRPAVTSALGELAGAGHLKRAPGGGWFLLGEAPPELAQAYAA